MAEVVWTGPALRDLGNVRDFIAPDSPRYARITIERIRSAVTRLQSFPLSGRVLPESETGPYREVIVAPYRVIYRFDEGRDRVLVSAVVHGRRLMPQLDATQL